MQRAPPSGSISDIVLIDDYDGRRGNNLWYYSRCDTLLLAHTICTLSNNFYVFFFIDKWYSGVFAPIRIIGLPFFLGCHHLLVGIELFFRHSRMPKHFEWNTICNFHFVLSIFIPIPERWMLINFGRPSELTNTQYLNTSSRYDFPPNGQRIYGRVLFFFFVWHFI